MSLDDKLLKSKTEKDNGVGRASWKRQENYVTETQNIFTTRARAFTDVVIVFIIKRYERFTSHE